MQAIGVRSLADCVQHCLTHCQRCTFVSFSKAHGDCSWYRRCPKAVMSFGGKSYQTQQVRLLEEAAPPPPPPPAWAAPQSAALGYCSLMGSALGSCLRSSQGSWPGVSTPAQCVARCRACERCAAVSFTLSNVSEATTPLHSSTSGQPPHWWRCRWYAACDFNDLRRSPPDQEGYVTLRIRGRRAVRAVKTPWHKSSITSNAGVGRALRLAIVALLESEGSGLKQGRHAATYATTVGANQHAYDAGMVQWCQNAARLRSVLPPHWLISQLVLSSDRGLAPRLSSLAGCEQLENVDVNPELRRSAMACVERLQYHRPVFFQGVVHGLVLTMRMGPAHAYALLTCPQGLAPPVRLPAEPVQVDAPQNGRVRRPDICRRGP